MNLVKPDYHHGLLNLMSSIQNHYQVSSHYDQLKSVDVRLKENQPVTLLLIDGMGANILKKHLPEESFLRAHIVDTITTVFPSTTVAATTAVNSGISPKESGWVGWFEYFQEIEHYVVMFLSIDQYTKENVEKDFAYHALPYVNVQEKMRANGYRTTEIYPAFRPDGVHSFDEMCERVLAYAQSGQYDYVYAYWDMFDTLMHKTGVDSKETHEMLVHIDSLLEKLYAQLPENHQLIVIADHGQINTTEWYLEDHEDLCACLKRKPACEVRTIVFYVKEEKEEEFIKLFHEYYAPYFHLMSSNEFIDEYLGKGEEHPRLREICGDYVAISTDQYNLAYARTGSPLKGQHAGETEDEMWIPVIMK